VGSNVRIRSGRVCCGESAEAFVNAEGRRHTCARELSLRATPLQPRPALWAVAAPATSRVWYSFVASHASRVEAHRQRSRRRPCRARRGRRGPPVRLARGQRRSLRSRRQRAGRTARPACSGRRGVSTLLHLSLAPLVPYLRGRPRPTAARPRSVSTPRCSGGGPRHPARAATASRSRAARLVLAAPLTPARRVLVLPPVVAGCARTSWRWIRCGQC